MIRPLRFLSFRLFLVLAAVLLVVLGVHAYMDIRATVRDLTDTVYASAAGASDLIVRSTRYGMLLNRKEDVHHIINTLGSEPGVEGINIYDKSGEIIYSTDSTTIGNQVDMQAEACVICHASDAPLTSLATVQRMRVYDSGERGRILGLINPIRNEPECSNATCHAHSPEQTILGVLDVKMSLADVDARVARSKAHTLISSLVMTLLGSLVMGVFIFRVVRRPIRSLHRGMQKIAAGDLQARISWSSEDEIGQLAGAFNRMADDLNKARNELKEWGHTLEDRVEEKTAELRRAQTQIVHMEKMASLGKLSASVAHEINNPLFGILTYAKLLLRSLGDGCEDDDERANMRKSLEVIQQESSRCGDIVKGLLDFARETGGEFIPIHVNDVIERTLVVLMHHFEMAQVSVVRELKAEDDNVMADPKQLQQVLVATCINAVEAMSKGGQLTLRTRCDAETVTIVIEDNGVGMPESVKQHVFEPFFTTKEGEAGTGLGLAVVYGIVQRHQGSIEIESERNKGTKFIVTLPRKPKQRKGSGMPGADEIVAANPNGGTR